MNNDVDVSENDNQYVNVNEVTKKFGLIKKLVVLCSVVTCR